jgi:ABC-type uncharacterized transport system permease subunit
MTPLNTLRLEVLLIASGMLFNVVSLFVTFGTDDQRTGIALMFVAVGLTVTAVLLKKARRRRKNR